LDPDFRDFLERDGDLPKSTNTSALSGAGMMRLFHKVGDAVEKISFKMDESDEVGKLIKGYMLCAFYLSEYCSIKLNFTSHSSRAHPVVMC
jgi:sorting nexin-1/2